MHKKFFLSTIVVVTLGFLVMPLFVSAAPPQSVSDRIDAIRTRINDRLEDVRERVENRQAEICERIDERGLPADPSFCRDDEDDAGDDDDSNDDDGGSDDDDSDSGDDDGSGGDDDSGDGGGDDDDSGSGDDDDSGSDDGSGEDDSDGGNDDDSGSDNDVVDPTGLVMSEVLYDLGDGQGSEPANEWIELYNGSSEELDLSGYILRDTSTSEDMIPEGTMLAAGAYLVIANATTTADFWSVASDIVYLESSLGNGFGNSGDALSLLTAEEVLVDSVNWGAETSVFDPAVPGVAPGHSIARCPVTTDTDSASDWVDEDTPTPGADGCTEDDDSGSDDETGGGDEDGGGGVDDGEPATTGEVVINEVLYDVGAAQGAEGNNEWVELYNSATSTVDLSGWLLRDGGDSEDVLPEGTLLEAGALLVITDATSTADFWSLPASTVYLDSSIGNGLGNDSDALFLVNGDGQIVDVVAWGEAVEAFNPEVTGVAAGHSIARCPVGVDTDGAADWVDQETPTPGSAQCLEEETGGGDEDGGGGIDDSDGGEGGDGGGDDSADVTGVVLSEVYYDTDVAHGTDGQNEWVEVYNGSDGPIELAGATIGDAASDDLVPTTTIPALGFLVIANSTTTADFWTIPESAVVVFLETSLGSGFNNGGDAVYLKDSAGAVIDALSYGDNTDVFNPSAPDVADGHSLARTLTQPDSDTAADWTERDTPTPGAAPVPNTGGGGAI